MTIDAVYAVNEYMKSAIQSAGYDCGEIYPGAFAPSTENTTKFVTYRVIPNDTYDLPGLKNDVVQYRFFNSNFDELHRIVGVVRRTFNVYDIEQTSLSEPDITFQETFFQVGSDGEASFAEGVDYYYLNCDLRLGYTANTDIYSGDTTDLFIQGE